MPQTPPYTPEHYPTYRFFADGRQVVVSTPQEWEALPPGHADNPAGPWPEQPPWTHDTAPFAPAPPNYRPPLQGGVDFICTWTPRRYAGRLIFPGQLVPRSFGPVEEALLRKDAVYLARWTDEARQHTETRWWFVTEPDLDAYARCWKTGDLMGWRLQPQGTLDSPADRDARPSRGTTDPEVPQVSHETTFPTEKFHRAMLECLQAHASITVERLAPFLGISNIGIRRLFKPYPGLYKTMKSQVEREYFDKPPA